MLFLYFWCRFFLCVEEWRSGGVKGWFVVDRHEEGVKSEGNERGRKNDNEEEKRGKYRGAKEGRRGRIVRVKFALHL